LGLMDRLLGIGMGNIVFIFIRFHRRLPPCVCLKKIIKITYEKSVYFRERNCEELDIFSYHNG